MRQVLLTCCLVVLKVQSLIGYVPLMWPNPRSFTTPLEQERDSHLA